MPRLSARLNSDGRLELGALSFKDGTLSHAWQFAANQGWSHVEILGDAHGLAEISLNRISDGRLIAFGADAKEGSVWQTWQLGEATGAWSSWEIMGQARGLGHLAVANNPGQLELFGVDTKEGSVPGELLIHLWLANCCFASV